MGMVFEKKKRYEIHKILVDFMRYSKIYSVRKDMPECFICSQEFSLDHMTHLAFIQDHTNQLLCTSCKDYCKDHVEIVAAMEQK